jgi:hypothetical protein
MLKSVQTTIQVAEKFCNPIQPSDFKIAPAIGFPISNPIPAGTTCIVNLTPYSRGSGHSTVATTVAGRVIRPELKKP